MGKQRRCFTREFKVEAVRLALMGDKPQNAVAAGRERILRHTYVTKRERRSRRCPRKLLQRWCPGPELNQRHRDFQPRRPAAREVHQWLKPLGSWAAVSLPREAGLADNRAGLPLLPVASTHELTSGRGQRILLSMKEIVLPLGRGSTLVDDCDYEMLSKFRWRAVRKWKKEWYAARNQRVPGRGRRKTLISMHRQILGLTDPSVQTDHKNGNGLDNRRENLRTCTPAQNGQNRGKNPLSRWPYKGICQKKGCSAWYAEISVNKKSIKLGSFSTAEDAARAYDSAAEKYFGEFPRFNFPQESKI